MSDEKEDTIIPYIENKYPETCKEFKAIQNEQYRLFCQKQADYGPGNISLGSNLITEDEKKLSQQSIVFKCFDKVQRLINLICKDNITSPQNEPVVDSWRDLSNYGIIAQIVMRGKWGK